jgi:hypothetical protein
MTAATLPRSTVDLRRMWADAPHLMIVALMLSLALVPLYAAMALDLRLFQGESPWLKPIKFHFALAIYAASLAFFARYMPEATRASRRWRWFIAAVVFAITAEAVWLSGAAMLNAASHFNRAHPVLMVVYPLMGAFAVLLTSASLVMGISVWRHRQGGVDPAVHLAVALGLVLTFVLTVPVAGYLSSQPGHGVGETTQTLWLMGWSRDAGDLRVAHFFATHALHAIPLAGLLAARFAPRQAIPLVWLATGLFVALVVGSFVQALHGRPFLPMLG